MPRPQAYNRLANLDALRGIAILLVLFSHLTISASPGFGLWESTNLNAGTVGVLIFFCVSGYVISWSTSDLVGRPGYQPVAVFLVRRMFRLLPPYFILAFLLTEFVRPDAVLAGVAGAFHADPFGYSLRFVTLTSGFNDDPTVFGGLEWTLAYEVVFYAACALFLSVERHVSNARLLYLPMMLLSVMALLPTGSFNNVPQVLGLRFEFFFIGVVTCLGQRGLLPAIDCAIMLTVSASSVVLRLVLTTLTYHRLHSGTLASPIAILTCLLVLLFLTRPPRLLSAVGVISYSLYLLHTSMPDVLPLLLIPAWLRPGVWAFAGVLAATACYHLVERRAIDVGKWIVIRIRLRGASARGASA